MPSSDLKSSDGAAGGGLRDRKKEKRREDILQNARALFATKGIDATTISEIADSVDVSPPTIFNYFGNKDGILIALITEGARDAERTGAAMRPRTDADFVTILLDMFMHLSRQTLDIAGKRVWRYAEAAAIRHPETELARRHAANDRRIVRLLTAFFDRYDLRLRAGVQADTELLGDLAFDVWNASLFRLIKADGMTLEAHRVDLQSRLAPVAHLLFEDAFLNAPVLKPEGP